jgi:hypothetical protein
MSFIGNDLPHQSSVEYSTRPSAEAMESPPGNMNLEEDNSYRKGLHGK